MVELYLPRPKQMRPEWPVLRRTAQLPDSESLDNNPEVPSGKFDTRAFSARLCPSVRGSLKYSSFKKSNEPHAFLATPRDGEDGSEDEITRIITSESSRKLIRHRLGIRRDKFD
jgi:hypothetical protein